MSNKLMTNPAPSPLDYAPLPSPRRRWERRLTRRWPVALFLVVGVLTILYGPRTWQHWRLMRLQEACMTAELPTDRPVGEGDPVRAPALIAAWPTEYQMGNDQNAARFDARWVALANECGLSAGRRYWRADLLPTTFLHERYTSRGQRRLVVLEGWGHVTVMEPAQWFGGELRVVYRGNVTVDKTSDSRLDVAYRLLPGTNRLHAGVADASDKSRFTAEFMLNGVTATWEYQLQDDDRVTRRLLDPYGFSARAEAARAAEEAPSDPVVPPHPR